jgi:hypothetical protein
LGQLLSRAWNGTGVALAPKHQCGPDDDGQSGHGVGHHPLGKIAISLLSAFAIVYFRFPLRMFCFWAIFITLMLPVEVRIGPTYKVVADLGHAQHLRRA